MQDKSPKSTNSWIVSLVNSHYFHNCQTQSFDIFWDGECTSRGQVSNGRKLNGKIINRLKIISPDDQKAETLSSQKMKWPKSKTTWILAFWFSALLTFPSLIFGLSIVRPFDLPTIQFWAYNHLIYSLSIFGLSVFSLLIFRSFDLGHMTSETLIFSHLRCSSDGIPLNGSVAPAL